jgi:hypothetical protein
MRILSLYLPAPGVTTYEAELRAAAVRRTLWRACAAASLALNAVLAARLIAAYRRVRLVESILAENTERR